MAKMDFKGEFLQTVRHHAHQDLHQTKTFSEDEELSFSFACGGWLKYYIFGVGKAIGDHGLDERSRYIGSSAGALTAVGMVLGGPTGFDEATHLSKTRYMPECRGTWTGFLKVAQYTSHCLDTCANLHNYHQVSPGKATVCATSLPWLRPIRASTFSSAQDLKSALMASSAAIPWAPLAKFRGHWCLDGGFSDFQPVLNEKTITVNPFYFAWADIKPSRYMPLIWAFHPPKDPLTIDWIYDLGYCDALEYFAKTGLLKCDHGDGVKTTSCSCRPKRDFHPYLDQENPDKVHKWLHFMGRVPGSALDALVCIWVVLLWKPVALLLIYSELLLRAAVTALAALLKCSRGNGTAMALSVMLAAHAHLPQRMLIAVLQYLFVSSLATRSTAREWRKCLDLLRNMFSASLFLRGMSVSDVELRKHQSLLEYSIFYRMHMFVL